MGQVEWPARPHPGRGPYFAHLWIDYQWRFLGKVKVISEVWFTCSMEESTAERDKLDDLLKLLSAV